MLKVMDPGICLLSEVNGPATLRRLERAGRTCYKSEDRITDDSAEKFVRMIVTTGHHSVLEHESVSVALAGTLYTSTREEDP